MTNATPAVRATAAKHGVRLEDVQGTGVGGRITTADVRAAAGLPRVAPKQHRPRAAVLSPPPVPGGTVEERRSYWSGTQMVQIDDYGRNPLLDDARQATPRVYQQALSGGPPPTLFEAGDLPVMTASGADPAMLLRLPWAARHPAARADQATLAQMMEDFAPNGTRADAVTKADRSRLWFGTDAGNVAYITRLSNWLRTSGTVDYNRDPAALQQAMQAMATQDKADQAAIAAKAAQAQQATAAATAAQAKAGQASRELNEMRRNMLGPRH